MLEAALRIGNIRLKTSVIKFPISHDFGPFKATICLPNVRSESAYNLPCLCAEKHC